MKKNLITVFISSSCFLLLLSCSSGGSGSNTALPAARELISVAITGVVEDANTGNPIASDKDPVTLVVYGDDTKKVIDGDGKSIYNADTKCVGPLTNKSGLFTIYVNPGSPVPDQISLRLVASARDYITSSEEVLITKKQITNNGTTTKINVCLKLVKATAPPPTVEFVKSAPLPTINGATQSSVTLTTPVSIAVVNGVNVNLGNASVSIPKTTTVYADAAKTQPLQGNVTVTMTYNNNTTSDSLATFPGGFMVGQDTSGNALSSPAAFISGGFASIEITDSNGNKAKYLDKTIDVTISVPQGTINPQTGVAVKAGDTIPIWSYDTTTGEWSVQKLSNGTIVTGTLGAADGDGNFPVTFQTDHLSYFNLDWWFWGNSEGGVCDAPITITGTQGYPIYMKAKLADEGWLREWRLDGGEPDPSNNTIRSAPTFPMTITAWLDHESDETKLNTFSFDTLCGGITLDLTNDVNRVLPNVVFGNINVTVYEKQYFDCDCEYDLIAVSSSAVFAVAPGEPTVSAVTDKNGQAYFLNLVAGKVYTFTVNHRDGWTLSADLSVNEEANVYYEFLFDLYSCTPHCTGSGGGG